MAEFGAEFKEAGAETAGNHRVFGHNPLEPDVWDPRWDAMFDKSPSVSLTTPSTDESPGLLDLRPKPESDLLKSRSDKSASKFKKPSKTTKKPSTTPTEVSPTTLPLTTPTATPTPTLDSATFTPTPTPGLITPPQTTTPTPSQPRANIKPKLDPAPEGPWRGGYLTIHQTRNLQESESIKNQPSSDSGAHFDPMYALRLEQLQQQRDSSEESKREFDQAQIQQQIASGSSFLQINMTECFSYKGGCG